MDTQCQQDIPSFHTNNCSKWICSKKKREKKCLLVINANPGPNFSEIRRYFSSIAGDSADIAVKLLKTADATFS